MEPRRGQEHMSGENGDGNRPNSSKKRGKSRDHSRRNGGNRNRGNRRPKRYGGPSISSLKERHAERIAAMDQKANQRFEQSERPMGFPEDLDKPQT